MNIKILTLIITLQAMCFELGLPWNKSVNEMVDVIRDSI